LTTNKKIVYIVAAVATVLAVIIGYRIYHNLAENKKQAGRATQGRVVAVELGKVSRQDIKPVYNFSANLEPLWSAEISAKVDGRIDKLFVDEGDVVKTGDVIALLDTNELAAQVVQAEGSLFSAQANLEQAELDLKRTDALAKQGAVSVQSLDTARIKRDLAIGGVRSAEGNLSLLRARMDNATITAPRDGIVTKRYLQSGFYAKTGSPIVTIADVTSLLSKATVGEAQVKELSLGTTVGMKVNALGDKMFAGKITRISPAASLPSRTFTAEVTVANTDGLLRAGMFAKVEIPGLVHKNALAIPEGALVLREDQKTVFVVIAENKVQQRVLKLGYVGGGWAEVLDGVKEGETIVVSGHNKLKDGSSISAPAGEGDK
jgi:membrane fusion protein (multidrug efflux system)